MGSQRQLSPILLLTACMGGGFLAVMVGMLVLRPGSSPSEERTVSDANQVAVDSPDKSPLLAETQLSSGEQERQHESETTETRIVKAVESEFSSRPVLDSVSSMPKDPLTSGPGTSNVPQPASFESPPETTERSDERPSTFASSEMRTQPKSVTDVAPPEKRPTQRIIAEPPAKQVPEIPEVRAPIESAKFGEIRKMISLEKRATDALAMHEVFAQSFEFTDVQQELVDRDFEEWKQRAEQKLYRMGTQWMPRDEANAEVAHAHQIIKQGDAALERGDYQQAVDLFEQASRSDLNGLRADYTLGLVYSLPFAGVYGVEKAEQHFRRVLLRDPNFAAAHNSLGITHVKQGKFSAAISDFERAADLLLYCPEVVQNLGRMKHLATLLRVDARNLSRCQELYDKYVSEKKGEEFRPQTGWLHMIPVFAEDERQASLKPGSAVPASRPEGLTPSTEGTAILVAPEYLLTSQTGIYSDSLGMVDLVGVQDGAGRERLGVVVAMSGDLRLALVHVPGLIGNPLPLSPTSDLSGPNASEGTAYWANATGVGGSAGIQSVPQHLEPISAGSEGTLGQCRLSAPLPVVASGSPILSDQGEVIALVTDSSGQGAAVPSTVAGEFLKTHLGRISPPSRSLVETPRNVWSEQLQGVVLSVTGYFESGIASVANSTAGSSTRTPYEDDTCPICNGRSAVVCTAPKCNGGEISVSENVIRYAGPKGAQKPVLQKVFRKVDCPVCNNGLVDCPHCLEGKDDSLHSQR
ncbi:MAG: tetratricopeptide repeat protein [Planctomycetaceae bacterium]|nr:tetratricopeptide repeat protein [Planctomycetaceae bacterium]